MISVPAGARVLLATRPVDFRKGAHGLAALAQEVLAADPFSGAVIADSNEGGHLFQSDRGHHSNLMAASLVSSRGPVLVMS